MSDTITPRITDVPIFTHDDWERLLELEEAIEAAETAAKKTPATGGVRLLSSPDPIDAVNAAQAAYDAFYAEASTRAEAHVRLRNVGGRRWREIRRGHPARDGHAADTVLGFDAEDAFEEILSACIVSPTFDSPEQLMVFIDSIPWGQQSALAYKAIRLNQDSRIPKAPSARSETSSAT